LEIDQNVIYDLVNPSRVVKMRIKSVRGHWEIWDWRNGSLQEARLDTFMNLGFAKNTAEVLMGVYKSPRKTHDPYREVGMDHHREPK
jgi:hypothetical protein